MLGDDGAAVAMGAGDSPEVGADVPEEVGALEAIGAGEGAGVDGAGVGGSGGSVGRKEPM